jgi:tetratricopeptide (TPR) repeat protein
MTLEKALELDPDDVVSRLNEGVLWLRTGETARAEERFRVIAGRNPGLPEASFNLARAEEQLGRFAEAAAAWRRYLEARPDDPDAMNHLAWLLATELDQPTAAEALARKCVAARPSNAGFLDTLAEALFRQGKREEAIRTARNVLTLEDSSHFRDQLARFLDAPRPSDAGP